MSAFNHNPMSVALEADQSAFQLYKTGIITSGFVSSAGYYHVKYFWGYYHVRHSVRFDKLF